MALLDLILGKPIATSDERAEQIGPSAGIPIFGLDALSSAAYGPEAALTLMIPLGLAGVHYIIPVCGAIVALLLIVYFSYQQTIAAYPTGGGSYTVARQNLGANAGLLAAAALLIDYVLVVAVGIAAGVGAMVSAIPSLQPYTLWLCLFILFLITMVNLRGVSETGTAFMIPTYLFVGTMLITIAGGVVQTLLSGGHPAPVIAPPALPPATEAAGMWLLLRVFASGCTALTGVEAVSNGVKAFRSPAVPNAQRTLTVIIVLLGVMLGGISYLVNSYGIGATDPGKPGYESVLSILVSAVFGKGIFYYLSIASIVLVVSLSANTSFADFPRLCKAIAHNNYLPHSFASRGRRLVYTEGILVLAALSGTLLVIFGGITDKLIPLFAVGAFLAFTLSQFGMVMHWRRLGGPGAFRSALVNGLGGAVTGVTVIIVLVAKFAEGAWMTLLFIPCLVLLFGAVRRHYHEVRLELNCMDCVKIPISYEPPIVVMPIDRWSRVARKGIDLAASLSPDIYALHVESGEHAAVLEQDWEQYAAQSFRVAGRKPPELVILESPYRFVIQVILDFVEDLTKKNPTRRIAVVIPEFVERRWYEYFLHNQRAHVLHQRLLVSGNERLFLVNAPWYFQGKK